MLMPMVRVCLCRTGVNILTSSNLERNQICDQNLTKSEDAATANTLNRSPDKTAKLAGELERRVGEHIHQSKALGYGSQDRSYTEEE